MLSEQLGLASALSPVGHSPATEEQEAEQDDYPDSGSDYYASEEDSGDDCAASPSSRPTTSSPIVINTSVRGMSCERRGGLPGTLFGA